MATGYRTEGSGALDPKNEYQPMDKPETGPKLSGIKGGGKGGGPASGGLSLAPKDKLKNTENNAAANPLSVIQGGANQAKDAEQNQPFANKVKGPELDPQKKLQEKTKSKGFLGKKGPLITIMIVLLGGGGLLGAVGSLSPIALIQRGIAEFNGLQTSMSNRSTYFMRAMLDESRNKSLTKYGIFGSSADDEHFSINKNFQKKLLQNNIKYERVTTPEGKTVRALFFTEADGSITPIVVHDSEAAALKGMYAKDPVLLDNAIRDNDDFFRAHQKATRTVKGHVAGWYDSVSESYHKRIKNSRNRFSDVPKDATDAEIVEAAKRTGLDVDADDSGVSDVTPGDDESKAEDDDTIKKGMDKDQLRKSLEAKVNKVATGSNVACAVLASIGALNAAVVAINTAKILNFATAYMEAGQKAQYGDGGSEMSYFQNGVSQRGNSVDINGNIVRENSSSMASPATASLFDGPELSAADPLVQKYNLESISMLGATGIAGQAEKDTKLKEGLLKAMGGVTGGIGGGIVAYRSCTIAQAATATVEMAVDVILIVTTVGIGNAVKSVIKGIGKTALRIAAQTAVIGIIGGILPTLADMLAMDVIENMAGEDASYMLNLGMQMYMANQHKSSDGTGGNAEAVATMSAETQKVKMAEARYDRMERSPFDITSENTFLGSIVYGLTPTLLNASSLPTAVTNFGGFVSSSLSSLLPSTSALTSTQYPSGYNEDCLTIGQFGLIGTSFCAPYMTVDFSLMETDPADILDTVNKMDMETIRPTQHRNVNGDSTMCRYGDEDYYWYEYKVPTNFENTGVYSGGNDCILDTKFDSSNNPIIKVGGDLSKYIVVCTVSDTQYGVINGNSAEWISNPTGSATLNSILNVGLSAVPAVGAARDIVESSIQLANIAWDSGQVCVNSPESNPEWNTKYKYFARYLGDQRTAEAFGLIETQAQLAVIENYYDQYPLDDSYEGVIAQYSGMTKDEVVAVLDLMDHLVFLAQYDPSELYPFPVETVEIALADQLPDLLVADHNGSPVPNLIYYMDTRNRSFAV